MNVGPSVSLDDAWKKITLKYSELKKLSPGVLGCRFLYSPRSTFTTNNGLLIAGMNPGREADMDDRAYPRKDCNAYLWEEWTRSGGYQDRVRNFVERLARALGQSDWQEFFNNSVTSNFLPFRSESYPALGSALRPAKAFAYELWLQLIPQLGVRTLVCFGSDAKAGFAQVIAKLDVGSQPELLPLQHSRCGRATDPYQPAERKYGLTRSMLEVLAQLPGLDLSITTKSSLIVRDLEWLKRINRRSKLSVNFSLITLDRKLQRILEPRAPRPGLRLRALFELARAGIRCNVLMMPMIPGLTDDPAAIESVIRGAHRAGASGVRWRSLFLKPAAARRFIPFVKERFPHLAERIDMFYARAEYVPHAYDDRMGAIFDRIRARYGFPIDHDRCMIQINSMSQPIPAQLNLRLVGIDRAIASNTVSDR